MILEANLKVEDNSVTGFEVVDDFVEAVGVPFVVDVVVVEVIVVVSMSDE